MGGEGFNTGGGVEDEIGGVCRIQMKRGQLKRKLNVHSSVFGSESLLCRSG